MNKIIRLPQEISQKIAAGEVIERPFSVVKELVENSLDAHSTEIRTDLLEGGRGLIQVKDNGHGMSQEDAHLCFESHATSKISSANDLDHISTLGFRGEALASISAVSRIRLKTSDGTTGKGTLVEREGQEELKVEDIGFPKGTCVEVRDLFFNVPARKKFLRSERAEFSRIVKYLTHAALAMPQVRFSLFHGKRSVFDYPAVKTLKERIYQVYGKTFLDSLLEIDTSDGERRFFGFASRPPSGRRDRSLQLLFVNSRPVKDATFQAALNQAYRNFLEKDRFAEAVLFLEWPYTEVDVNVHPAKAEIRFADSQPVFQMIFRSIEQAVLKEMGVKDIYPVSEERPKTLPRIQESHSPRSFERPITQEPSYSHDLFTSWGKEETEGPKVLGQYLNCYIVAADEDGVLIIDQHNAHERVLFEKYERIDREKTWPRKMALRPPLLELSPSQAMDMEENQALLEELGFQVDAMGGRSYALKEYPDIFKEKEAEEMFFALIENVKVTEIADRKKAILATMACKSAIKAGEPLAFEKIRYLVQELFKTSNPGLCPHGRPVTLRLSKSEIEKGLGR